jgi:hypothetical protein
VGPGAGRDRRNPWAGCCPGPERVRGRRLFGWDYDFFADSSKARRAGFHEYVETEQMFYRIFADLRRRRVVP